MRNSLSLILVLILSAIMSSCGGGGGGGSPCGGPSGAACAAGEFCSFSSDLSCGAGDAEGSCEPIPASCDSAVTTVCSCEGLTFFNECFANAASQSVRGPGECA